MQPTCGLFLKLRTSPSLPLHSESRPHPSSPKCDNVNFESALRLFLVVFGGGAPRSGRRGQVVDIAIHFNDQPRPMTVKIDDESRNDLLL